MTVKTFDEAQKLIRQIATAKEYIYSIDETEKIPYEKFREISSNVQVQYKGISFNISEEAGKALMLQERERTAKDLLTLEKQFEAL